MATLQKVTPFLWFDGNAEEAARFYTSIFADSRIEELVRAGADGPASSVTFRIAGLQLIAFNGGPHFQFTPAVSLFVHCDTQSEVDRLWEALSAGGEPGRCGWLKDRFGLSWQIVPSVLGPLLHDRDREKAKRVMTAMLKMSKLDIGELQRAYEAG